MIQRVPNVLTIAGSDPTGGAGIQGDLKTFAALRVHGCAVITALTAQSTRGVRDVMPVPAAFVTRQLETLLDDVEIAAIKIGMLGDASVVRAVASLLQRRALPNLVLDPVLRASAGGALLDGDGLAVLREELVPLADVVTPNVMEAGALLGERPPRTEEEAVHAAQRLLALGARSALVTGGHLLDDTTCVDILATSDAVHAFRTRRVAGHGTHGTGCVLSSAIAALLARARTLSDACTEAQLLVAESIATGDRLAVGHGAGPVHVLSRVWR
jgi:hydroxymethylpyrimidine/phosphomethylpyrimidine kinase